MARRRVSIERAAALQRRVTAVADVAQEALDGYAPEAAPVQQYAEQHELAARLRAAATQLVPDWLGASLDVFPSSSPLPAPGAGTELPRYVRLGVAQPVDDARFPVVVPLGNLAIDADARDTRAAGLLSSLLLRLVAATPAGMLYVRAVDATGTVFGPFGALVPAGLMAEPAADAAGLRAALDEAEEWVREPGRQVMLLVVASLPELTEDADLDRIAALAQDGPANRLHLIVAGWPPPPLTRDSPEQPLRHATQVTLRNPYAIVSDPPGGTFGAAHALNSPVYLDDCPPAESIHQVCAQVAAQAAANGSTLAELLPRKLWQEDATAALAVTVGRAGDTSLTLQFSELTPHWLVGGGPGAETPAFLMNILYGLSTRYSPADLVLYLLSFREEEGLPAQFVPAAGDRSWMPHVRAATVSPDRAYALAVLRDLETQLAERQTNTPRVVCVIEDFDVLVRGDDRTANEALALLDSLARKGRTCGVHLLLSASSLHGLEALRTRRDSPLGQFPVRIALTGGGDVLDRLNQAANDLSLSEAVVNTAGGLGGPVGASRAHERLVTFPDPLRRPEILATLRHRLWEARPPGAAPPHVFDGRTPQHLPAALPVAPHPTAYLGRLMDVPLSLAGFTLSPEPGRHLAVLGPSELGADILDCAARSLAMQHRPGSVDFVLASFAAARASVARLLDQSLRTVGHRSRMVDAAGFKEIVDDPDLTCTYVIGFGLDAAPGAGLQPLLVGGPARQVHLLGWWRGLRRLREETDGTPAGLVVLNLPAAEASLLVGDAAMDWQPRPNRALLHDRDSGRTDLILPFVHSGRSG
ncbi:MAG TPA: cell division protein FtsK [Rugosimonospora sp.]|nr:cell division protein FtsK [Rugosimonospora sp.]